nr:MAG TPA: hypothetical protein [Caudoviricetes sp.]
MLLTNWLESGSFENAKGEKLAEFLYSSRRFGRIYGLLTGSFGVKSTNIREFCEFAVLDFWSQKFILSPWVGIRGVRIVRTSGCASAMQRKSRHALRHDGFGVTLRGVEWRTDSYLAWCGAADG